MIWLIINLDVGRTQEFKMTHNINGRKKSCPSHSALNDYYFEFLDEEDMNLISLHLKECKYCTKELKEIQEFVGHDVQSEIDEYYLTHKLSNTPMPKELLHLFQGKQVFLKSGLKLLKGGDVLGAKKSFDAVLSIDPGNREAKSKINEICDVT